MQHDWFMYMQQHLRSKLSKTSSGQNKNFKYTQYTTQLIIEHHRRKCTCVGWFAFSMYCMHNNSLGIKLCGSHGAQSIIIKLLVLIDQTDTDWKGMQYMFDGTTGMIFSSTHSVIPQRCTIQDIIYPQENITSSSVHKMGHYTSVLVNICIRFPCWTSDLGSWHRWVRQGQEHNIGRQQFPDV